MLLNLKNTLRSFTLVHIRKFKNIENDLILNIFKIFILTKAQKGNQGWKIKIFTTNKKKRQNDKNK